MRNEGEGTVSIARKLGRIVALLLALTVVQVEEAGAFPLTSPQPWVLEHSLQLLPNGFEYDGVVAMSNCSASLVRFKGASDDALALVMTNGHCVGGGLFGGGMLKPNEIYYNKQKTFSVSLLDRNATKIMSLRSDKIVYATMTDTDLAILELTSTYREIRQKAGVEALEIADLRADIGEPIAIPSGYWKKTYNCEIEAVVTTLKESDWTFKNSIRYSPTGCEVVGGTSGSPIVSARTGKLVGINNTGNESGARCSLNNPCEVDEAGNVRVIKGRGYGQQIVGLYTCLNNQDRIDISVAGCVLPKGKPSPLL